MNKKYTLAIRRISIPFLFLLISFFCFIPVNAVIDTTAPEISSFSVDKNIVKPGDTLAVTFHLEEAETGLNSFTLFLKFSSESTYYYGISKMEAPARFNGNLGLTYSAGETNLYTGDHIIYIKITDETVPGTYTYASFKNIRDQAGNKGNASFHLADSITVINPDYYTKQLPDVTDLKIEENELSYEDNLNVRLTINGEAEAIERIDLVFRSLSDSNQKIHYFEYWGPLNINNYIVSRGTNSSIFEIPLPPNRYNTIIQGDYQLYYLTVTYVNSWQFIDYKYDADTNSFRIWKEQKDYSFPISGNNTIHISDSIERPSDVLDDGEAPVLHSMKVLNPVVYHPYDYITIEFKASDNRGINSYICDIIDESTGINYGHEGISLGNANNGSPYVFFNNTTQTYTIRQSIDCYTPPGIYRLDFKVIDSGVLRSNKISTYIRVSDGLEDYNISLDYTATNPSLIKDLNSLQEGQSARIRCEHDDNIYIPKEVFESIKGRDVYIILQKMYYYWIFYGKDIVEPKDIWVKMTQELDREYPDTIRLVFPQNGTLPGKLKVRFRTDHLLNIFNVTGSLYFYYEDSNTKQLFLDANARPTYEIQGINHWCSFDFDHHSTYLLSGRDLLKKATVTAAKKELPKPPARITSIKVKKKKKKKNTILYLTWTECPNALRYELEYSTNKKFKKNSRKVLKTSHNNQTITIKKNKVYYIRVRAYVRYSGAEEYLYGRERFTSFSPVIKIKK